MDRLPAPLAAVAAQLQQSLAETISHPSGRFFWPGLLCALAIMALAHATRPDWRQRWSPGGNILAFCFPPALYRHRSTFLDLRLNLLHLLLKPAYSLALRLNLAWFTALIAGALAALLGPSPAAFTWTMPVIAGFSLLVALSDDLGYWLWHILAHKHPLLWRIHRVHHEAEVLTPLAAGREHPIEVVLMPLVRAATTALLAGPALYLSGAEPRVLTLFGIALIPALFALPLQQLSHAHLPIAWPPWLNHILICPATHHLHHSSDPRHHDRNMGGLFALWDWLFGTLILPTPNQPLTFGLTNTPEPPPHTLRAALLAPFQKPRH